MAKLVPLRLCLKKKNPCRGGLGDSVGWASALGFSQGWDLRGMRWSPMSGSLLSVVCLGFSASPSAPLPVHSLSFYKINKHVKSFLKTPFIHSYSMYQAI